VIDPRDVTVIAATGLEARAVRRECPQLNVMESGIALAKLDRSRLSDAVISCGLAGGLSRELPTGTVLIPREVARVDGNRVACDEAMQRALVEAARRLGFDPVEEPMMTSATIVHGEERARFAERGFVGVDMESGLIDAPRIAVVRVILDTPDNELSAAWARPAIALMNPLLWPQAAWLARNAPRCARIAAVILNEVEGSPRDNRA